MSLLLSSNSSRFFGLDVSKISRYASLATAGVMRSRWLAWLDPAIDVRVQRADGREEVWTVRSDAIRLNPGVLPTPGSSFMARELPPARFLRRAMALPALPPDEQSAAVELDVHSASPFSADQLLWASRVKPGAGGVQEIEAVLTSRQQVASWLGDAQSGTLQHPSEVWAMDGFAEPIVLPGYGEPLREVAAARKRRVHLLLLGVALALLAALLVSPTLQLRAKAVSASEALVALQQRAAPLVARRDVEVRRAESLAEVRKFASSQASALKLLNALSTAMPDDAWLSGLRLDGLNANITGYAANAATLLRVLEQVPGIHDVKATAAATRQTGSDKESFTVSFRLDPVVFGVMQPAKGQS